MIEVEMKNQERRLQLFGHVTRSEDGFVEVSSPNTGGGKVDGLGR